MSFVDLLQASVGKTIEVFLIGKFFTGVLISVNSQTLVIQTSGGQYYYGPAVNVTIILSQIQSVHIVP